MADKSIYCTFILIILFDAINVFEALGTIVSTPNFNAKDDAKQLSAAMKGIGTNDATVIRIICGRTNDERQAIAAAYQVDYSRSLHRHIQTDTIGNYGALMEALMVPTAEFDAAIAYKSMKGLGTNFDLLLEVLLSRPPQNLIDMSAAYLKLYGRQLKADIEGDVNGDVENLLTTIVLVPAAKSTVGRRSTSKDIDETLVLKDAKALANASLNKWGTDKEIFIDILTSRSYPQLNATFAKFEDLTKISIEATIQRETSGKIQQSLLTLVECIRHSSSFFARKLHRALKANVVNENGIFGGTDEEALIRIMVSRAELDLSNIKNDYAMIYDGKTLENHIRSDVHGKFQDALIVLLKGNRPAR